MSDSPRNSRQSGEYDRNVEPPARVPVRDYMIAVGLTVVLVLAVVFLRGGSP